MTNTRHAGLFSRRRFLKTSTGAALLAGAAFPTPAISQGATKIKMTLPWLPQGAQLFPFNSEVFGEGIHHHFLRNVGVPLDALPALKVPDNRNVAPGPKTGVFLTVFGFGTTSRVQELPRSSD